MSSSRVKKDPVQEVQEQAVHPSREALRGQAVAKLRAAHPDEFRALFNALLAKHGYPMVFTPRERAQQKLEQIREQFPELFTDPPEGKDEEPSIRVETLIDEGPPADPAITGPDPALDFDTNDYA